MHIVVAMQMAHKFTINLQTLFSIVNVVLRLRHTHTYISSSFFCVNVVVVVFICLVKCQSVSGRFVLLLVCVPIWFLFSL